MATGQDNQALKQYDSWSEVKQEVRSSGKLIFVDVYFTGCFLCKQMDREDFRMN